MNSINSNDKGNSQGTQGKSPQINAQGGKDSVRQGKDARSATASGNAPQQTAGKDASQGTESPSKS